MWRYLMGAVAALLLAGGGMLLINGRTRPPNPLAAIAAPTPAAGEGQADAALPASVPEASAQTREQRRFGRYDKDRDGSITREEYLMQRRRAFARLDLNHDGQLSFDEWAARTISKFTTADRDHNGAMNATEFATTAPVRRATTRRAAPCPQQAAAPAARGDDGNDDS